MNLLMIIDFCLFNIDFFFLIVIERNDERLFRKLLVL